MRNADDADGTPTGPRRACTTIGLELDAVDAACVRALAAEARMTVEAYLAAIVARELATVAESAVDLSGRTDG